MKEIITLREQIGTIKEPKEIFNKIKKINIDFTQENVIIFYLDVKLKLIDKEILFKGGLDSCILDGRTLFRKALLKNANSIIISHNHPSNSLTPSNEDKIIYNKLKEIGKIIGIDIMDSIIFNKTQFYSLNEVV